MTSSSPTPKSRIAETWRVTVWGIGLNTFQVDVYDDRTWRLMRVGLKRLGDFELVELARGGPSVDFEADIRAAVARWPGTVTLQRDSADARRARWTRRAGRTEPNP
ncbi:hypothetical protein [Burkholderia glumae]|uniref:hypothetical protein n=1 Tax=Burkholderia glumae TaxID=337 RepID=UPI0015932F5D|nr:hypothetical protein [Burkholderia glumae]NVE26285.1 hypothetical protein [Burkholderia glumae]